MPITYSPLAFGTTLDVSAILKYWQFELDGRSNGWTTITDVKRTDSITVSYGIDGNTIRQRVAPPGEGQLSLDNSERNSVGLASYYSPYHPNCRIGFEIGIRARWVWEQDSVVKVKFLGRIDKIKASSGRYDTRTTYITVVDYMTQLSDAKLSGIPVQVDKRSSEVFQTIINNLSTQPESVSIEQGASVFPYALDNSRDESIQAISEANRLAISEYGLIYVTGGVLKFESRTTRATRSVNVAVFDGSFQTIGVEYDRQRTVNSVQVIIHPKRVDETPNTVLFQLQNSVEIAPGETKFLLGPYRDPTQTASRVGGTDMQDPIPGVDYIVNSVADGSGTNLTADFSVIAQYGGNGVRLSITNNGFYAGYTGGLAGTCRVRGKGIYDFENIVAEQKEDTSIQRIGEIQETLDQPYQSDITTGNELALYILSLSKQNRANIDRMAFMASSPVLLEQAFNREISDRIGIVEPQTGLSLASSSIIPRGYFINGIKIRCTEDILWMEYVLAIADSAQYWFLEIVGSSELDATTLLGFGLVVGHTDVLHGDVSSGGHTDSLHGDVAHGDSAHLDTSSHGDTAHGDAGHSDTSHGDIAHADTTHADTAHVDGNSHDDHNDQAGGHNDTGGGKTHSDVTHSDTAHQDNSGHGDTTFHNDQVSHEDVTSAGYHNDGGSGANHGDESGGTYHADTDTGLYHVDNPHVDSAHSDVSHGDNTHEDFSGHNDTAHSDTAHADSHSDAAHGDVSHNDVSHVDNAGHGDMAAVSSPAHTDTAHGDVAAIPHSDNAHGDAN